MTRSIVTLVLLLATACGGALAPNTSDAGVPYAGPPDASVEQDAECGYSTTVGNARVHLHLANGSPLYSLPFGITGPSLYANYGNTVQITDASDVVFVWGGLPAGGPDTISVQVAPGVTCDGSAPLSIVACTTIDVTLDVTCTEPPEAGCDDAD